MGLSRRKRLAPKGDRFFPASPDAEIPETAYRRSESAQPVSAKKAETLGDLSEAFGISKGSQFVAAADDQSGD